MNSGNVSNTGNNFGEKAFVYLVYLYAVALPLRFNLKTVLLFLFLGLLAWQVSRTKFLDLSLWRSNAFKALAGYLGVCLLSVLYTSDPIETFEFILRQSTLLLLPIIFYRKLTWPQVHRALLLFCLSCFALSVYALLYTINRYQTDIPAQFHSLVSLDWTYFSYFLPQYIKFHAPYYSLYIGTCLIILSYFLYTCRGKENKLLLAGYALLWLFFFAFQALLSSRMSLVATVAVLSLVAVYLAFKAKKYLLLLAVVVTTVGSSALLLEKVPYLRAKFKESAGVSQREIMWKSAADLIKKNPILGFSPGDTEDALVQRYAAYGFQEGVTGRFDAHNQYLMHGVSLGLVGVLALLLVLFFFLREAVRRNNFILFTFVTVFALCCLTESLLQRRDGTLLFSFITALLFFSPKENLLVHQPRSPKEETLLH
ncbi:O-antigen ligase family protein [Rufibacter glacialis]|uniref:O-antigen ligase family protein n=1 Tax=Rufibacter glacialis TaxID=1259555 RepID=A0A5M8QII0_9BACT|nr:O-antigen ligase family protein [Rufibacter glacialis]KAA6434596.1 O-antigen ligase family protein [Rufibacter glacialis]GGK70843.1 hypothetical protein GCM10011405_18800 [Rufibacter glacialis]